MMDIAVGQVGYDNAGKVATVDSIVRGTVHYTDWLGNSRTLKEADFRKTYHLGRKCFGPWRHRNGNVYWVIGLANEYTENPEKYPVMVIYQGGNGRVWCRPMSEWSRSFTRLDSSEK